MNARNALAARALLTMAAAPANDAAYRARFDAFMANPAQFDYSPMEAVPGASRVKPMAQRSTPAIAAAALDEAERYAEANRSTALLVWRDGALESARYFGSTTRETPLVSKSLAKPLTGVKLTKTAAGFNLQVPAGLRAVEIAAVR